MKKSYIIIIALVLLAASASAFYYSDLPAWDIGPITFHHKVSSLATTTPVANVKDLPRDKCPCWDGKNNICLPQSSCE